MIDWKFLLYYNKVTKAQRHSAGGGSAYGGKGTKFQRILSEI